MEVDGDLVPPFGYQAPASDRDDQLFVGVGQPTVGDCQRYARLHVRQPDVRHPQVFGVEHDPAQFGRHLRHEGDVHAARVRQLVQVGVHAQRVRLGRHAGRQPVRARRTAVIGVGGHRSPIPGHGRGSEPVGHVRVVRRRGRAVHIRLAGGRGEEQRERDERVTDHRRVLTDRRDAATAAAGSARIPRPAITTLIRAVCRLQ